jgi:hypothetical protein
LVGVDVVFRDSWGCDVPNPYAHGQPADPVREFAGREDEIRRVRACVESTRAGHVTHVFVEGEWGIGKTSLLNKLLPELQEHGPVISEDLADDPAQARWFYSAIFSELLEKEPSGVTQEQFEGLDVHDSRRLRKLLKGLWDGLREVDARPELVVIMLDNLERAQPEFLSGVRDVFQRLAQEGARFMLIFAGKHLPTEGDSASDPVGRFFNPRIVLHPLNEAGSIEAIKKPVRFLPFSFTDEAARLIHDRADGHPYFLKLICHEAYDLAGGDGEVGVSELEKLWPEVERRLESARFGEQFSRLPEGEQLTLLHASLLGEQFEAKELRSVIKKSLDTYLSRLLDKRELLRSPSRGVYQLYHTLFRTYLQAKAHVKMLRSTKSVIVPEGRPVLGQFEVEDRIAGAAERKLDVLDQHFRGRAVSMLEAVGPGVRIRILMGEDPAWTKTERLLNDLEVHLRKRIEVRAWPDKSEMKSIPFHYRCLIGDREIWRFDHSLDGAGKKLARFTDDSGDRKRHQHDFDRWWGESKRIFPAP